MGEPQRIARVADAPGTPGPEPDESALDAGALDESALRVLDFERRWTTRAPAKDAAIRAEFGFGSARYYQMLFALIDSPSALRHDPLLVRRLQRLRDAGTRARLAGGRAPDPLPNMQDRDD